MIAPHCAAARGFCRTAPPRLDMEDCRLNGLRIRELRKAWNLRQPEMAHILGITPAHLSRVETAAIPVSMGVQQILTLLESAASVANGEVESACEFGKSLGEARQDVRQMLILLRLIERVKRNGIAMARSIAQEHLS